MHDKPNANTPAYVAQRLTDLDGVDHANGDSKYKSSGTEFRVVCWIDEDDTARTVADAVEVLRVNKYGDDLDVRASGKTDSIKVEGRAETDERND